MDKRNPIQRKDSHEHEAREMDRSTLSAAAESEEATTLEKIWQPLFEHGNPTMRLGQFLRGLAIHLIEDYEPQGSLVVTPAKMMQFFDETRVVHEHYPWAAIFGGRQMAHSSVSFMYRKLLCQHHLVQRQYHEAPIIPGLTPVGFETFMTCMIQAHPDTEFERLAKAVREMPISNADDKTERFPKQLSRRLLPAEPNKQAEQRMISSLDHEAELIPPERRASAMPPPPPEPPLKSYVPERERKPYSQTSQQSQEMYEEDDDVSPPAMPIERERKPYFAKEGTGKKYEDEDDRDRDRDRGYERDGRPYRQDLPSARRSSRAGSGYSTATDPMNIPFSNRSHRLSTGPPPAGHTWSNSARRSPTSGGGFARSDPFDVDAIAPSQYASNLHGPPLRDPPMRGTRDPSMRDPSMRDPSMRDPSTRDPSTRDPSMRDPSMRDPSMRDLPTREASTRDRLDDDEYFSRSGPSRGGPPMPTNYDPPYSHGNSVNSVDDRTDRRRSWYTGIPPPGMQLGGPGTDGYGSYSGRDLEEHTRKIISTGGQEQQYGESKTSAKNTIESWRSELNERL